jgi:3-oxoacyl-[acyl-carrier protein] reductase
MSKSAKKMALVTGGFRGIGAAIAKRLAADGASVAIRYAKDAAAAAVVVNAIKLGGGEAIAIQADAANVEAIMAAVEKAAAAYGRLDVLVNNAGTAIPKPFEESTLEEIDRVIDINIRGVFVTTQVALKHMKDGGRIINIGSAVGERVQVPGLVPYSATKGAVKIFTQALSREVASRGITVNNVQPGPIDTDLNPASGDWARRHRHGYVEVHEDGSGTRGRTGNTGIEATRQTRGHRRSSRFCGIDGARWITGASIPADGGSKL